MAKNIIKTAYDEKQSFSYDQKRFTTKSGKLFHDMEVRQLRKALLKVPLSTETKVLEIGCGTGRFAQIVLETNRSVTSVDPSTHMINIARNKCSDFQNATFIESEGAQLPFKDHNFDFTYSIRVLNQTETKEYAFRIIKEAIRVTRPGGNILVEFCNSWRPRKSMETSVRLSPYQVVKKVKSFAPNSKITISGILFLSGTLLDKTPENLLTIFRKIDYLFSFFFPYLSARCYLQINLEE